MEIIRLILYSIAAELQEQAAEKIEEGKEKASEVAADVQEKGKTIFKVFLCFSF